jgi:betaine lipid synthase
MLKLAAAHMQERQSSSRPLIWIDVGGGTGVLHPHTYLFIYTKNLVSGWNIETMNEYMPIKSFDAIYLVDLCDSLLQIARKRFAVKGWTNVHVLHQDACTFALPDWPADGGVLPGSVALVTLSYSLSMIPSYYRLLGVDQMLDPTDGLVGVVDFYAARKNAGLHEESIGGVGKLCGWLGHWFW